jgi:biotin-[acetyl-CoA-carboxylase] ligase BirA-like protein
MHCRYHDDLDSTNEEAKRLLATGDIAESTCIVARRQHQGRGTRGRSWVSPRDVGVYMSVVQKRSLRPARRTTILTLSAGVAAVDAIFKETGVRASLKPVNDLMVDGAKLGGILTESIIVGGEMQALITGIGVNVLQAPRDVGPDAPRPISLEDLGFRPRAPRDDINRLAEAIALSVDMWHAKVFDGAIEEVLTAWHSRAIPGAVLPEFDIAGGDGGLTDPMRSDG